MCHVDRLQDVISHAKQKIKDQASVISEQCIILRNNGLPQAFASSHDRGQSSSSGAGATGDGVTELNPSLVASTQHREADSTLGKNVEDSRIPSDLSRDGSPTVSDSTRCGSSSPPSPTMLAPLPEGPSAPPPSELPHDATELSAPLFLPLETTNAPTPAKLTLKGTTDAPPPAKLTLKGTTDAPPPAKLTLKGTANAPPPAKVTLKGTVDALAKRDAPPLSKLTLKRTTDAPLSAKRDASPPSKLTLKRTTDAPLSAKRDASPPSKLTLKRTTGAPPSAKRDVSPPAKLTLKGAIEGPRYIIYTHTHGTRTDYETSRPSKNKTNPRDSKKVNETPGPPSGDDTRTICETPKPGTSGQGLRRLAGKVRYKAVANKTESPPAEETTPTGTTPTNSNASSPGTDSPSLLSPTKAVAMAAGVHVGEEEEEPMSCSLFAATSPATDIRNAGHVSSATPTHGRTLSVASAAKTPHMRGATVDQLALNLSMRKILAAGKRLLSPDLVSAPTSPDVVPVTPGVKLVESILENNNGWAGGGSGYKERNATTGGENGRGEDGSAVEASHRTSNNPAHKSSVVNSCEAAEKRRAAGGERLVSVAGGMGRSGMGRAQAEGDAVGGIGEEVEKSKSSIVDRGVSLRTRSKGSRVSSGANPSTTDAPAKVSKTLALATATGAVKRQYRKRRYNMPPAAEPGSGSGSAGRKRPPQDSPVLGRRAIKRVAVMSGAVERRSDGTEVIVVEGDAIPFTESSEPQEAAREEEEIMNR